MATLEVSRCRFCSKRFCYSGPYDRHLAREHPSALQGPSAGSGQREVGPRAPGSDYEDPPEEIATSHRGSPKFDYEDVEVDLPAERSNNLPLETTFKVYPEAGRPIRDAPQIMEEATRPLEDPWYPFSNPLEFKHARWMIESSLAKSNIDRYFRDGLCTSSSVAFTSGWTLYKQLDRMYPELGPDSWRTCEANWSPTAGLSRRTTYYYRSPLRCIEYLLKQPCFRDHLIYAPIQEFNEAGERMYSEMHTADWWWSTQVCYDPLRNLHCDHLMICRRTYHQDRRFSPSFSHQTKRI